MLKWFYRPKAYNDNFVQLFPAYKSVGLFYLLQALELPYLLNIGEADALLYANAFSLFLYPPLMLFMCGRYFFAETSPKQRDFWALLASIVFLLPLLLQAVGLVRLPEWHRTATFTMVGAVFVWYFWRNIRMALRIGRAMRRVNEDTYADIDDFPTRVGEKLQWLPTSICLLIAVNFFLDDPAVKAFRDVLFTVVDVWFCIYTLNPRRKAFEISGLDDGATIAKPATPDNQSADEPDDVPLPTDETPFRLTDDRYTELSRRLESLLTVEHIYTEQHITADTLMQHLGINANYLTEVIQRSGYSSFYDMICQHRVRHAISLIRQHPDRRMADIATDCGFTSPSSMSKAFASQGKPSPSVFRKSE